MTEKIEVTWGSEFTVTPKLQGTWIEVKYEGGLCFDFKKKSEEPVSKLVMEDLIKDLAEIIDLLFWDVGWYSPFIIEIDDQGLCHLLACTGVDERVRSLDMILRTGTKQTVTVTQDEESKSISII